MHKMVYANIEAVLLRFYDKEGNNVLLRLDYDFGDSWTAAGYVGSVQSEIATIPKNITFNNSIKSNCMEFLLSNGQNVNSLNSITDADRKSNVKERGLPAVFYGRIIKKSLTKRRQGDIVIAVRIS